MTTHHTPRHRSSGPTGFGRSPWPSRPLTVIPSPRRALDDLESVLVPAPRRAPEAVDGGFSWFDAGPAGTAPAHREPHEGPATAGGDAASGDAADDGDGDGEGGADGEAAPSAPADPGPPGGAGDADDGDADDTATGALLLGPWEGPTVRGPAIAAPAVAAGPAAAARPGRLARAARRLTARGPGRGVLVVATVLVLSGSAGVLAAHAVGDRAATPATAATPELAVVVGAPIVPAPSPVVPSTGDRSSTVGAGTHRVGDDVAPGTYESGGPSGPGGVCSWSRRGPGPADVRAAGTTRDPATVVVRSSDAAFVTTGCQIWRRR